MNDIRIGGTIFKHKYTPPDPGQRFGKGCAIIVGDDGHHYMFMPSMMRAPNLYRLLTIGTQVVFYPKPTPNGLRATGVSVVRIAEKHDDGASHQTAI